MACTTSSSPRGGDTELGIPAEGLDGVTKPPRNGVNRITGAGGTPAVPNWVARACLDWCHDTLRPQLSDRVQ
ncbi:hypothetical protein FRAAL2922 [Frankia alni ACN14a]|uniref:Uncharacterized protein n=1 Tax=Frankia alni (strain DSM 45986 / CECT 9034 / ACN14a) TaxID=326424 RepID=Q0RLN8_FRAAA|nr:hypothetical protein FRAAL2922 [Frankia alni ACN14a]